MRSFSSFFSKLLKNSTVFVLVAISSLSSVFAMEGTEAIKTTTTKQKTRSTQQEKVSSALDPSFGSGRAKGQAEKIEKIGDTIQVTTKNDTVPYLLESKRFPVTPGEKISILYEITVEAQGRMSLGLLRTDMKGWYGKELYLGAGSEPKTYKDVYERFVPEGETEASLVLRNAHLKIPGQTIFTIKNIDILKERVIHFELDPTKGSGRAKGQAEKIERIGDTIKVTTKKDTVPYLLESDRFPVTPGAKIRIPYEITIEAQGQMSLGLLRTDMRGWYGKELYLSAGSEPKTHEGVFERIVPEGEKEASLVLRNAHLKMPGQTIFTIKYIDVTRKSQEMSFDNWPIEIIFKVCDYLTKYDLNNFALTSKTYYNKTSGYLVTHLLGQINTLDYRLSDKTSYALSRCEKNPKVKEVFLENLMSQPFLYIPKGSQLAPFLQAQFPSMLDEADLSNNLEKAGQLYQALFDSPFPTNDEEAKIALTHLLAAWPIQDVYFPQENKEQSVTAFFQRTWKLKEKLDDLAPGQPYFSLINSAQDITELKETTHNIIITDKQLADPNIKEKLQDIFQAKRHTLILSVEEGDFVKNNVLQFVKEDLPPFLQKLWVVDTKGAVKIIGDDFLRNYPELTEIHLPFTQLTTIGGSFLSNCTGLTKVHLPFTQLTTIGDNFLRGCNGLTEVHMPFTHLTAIGNYFLYDCARLPEVDLSFTHVTTIGDYFLNHCRGLPEVHLPFTHLTTIGNYSFQYSGKLRTIVMPSKIAQLFVKDLSDRVSASEEKGGKVYLKLK